jgi:hypothetical protein
LILLVGWLVSFVDNDEAEIFDWRKESRTRADDDLRLNALEAFLPDLVADGLGLGGMLNDDVLEMLLKIADDLGGKGDFWDEDNDGLAFGEGMLGELDINVGFAATGDAVQENGVGGIGFDLRDGGLLGGV